MTFKELEELVLNTNTILSSLDLNEARKLVILLIEQVEKLDSMLETNIANQLHLDKGLADIVLVRMKQYNLSTISYLKDIYKLDN